MLAQVVFKFGAQVNGSLIVQAQCYSRGGVEACERCEDKSAVSWPPQKQQTQGTAEARRRVGGECRDQVNRPQRRAWHFRLQAHQMFNAQTMQFHHQLLVVSQRLGLRQRVNVSAGHRYSGIICLVLLLHISAPRHFSRNRGETEEIKSRVWPGVVERKECSYNTSGGQAGANCPKQTGAGRSESHLCLPCRLPCGQRRASGGTPVPRPARAQAGAGRLAPNEKESAVWPGPMVAGKISASTFISPSARCAARTATSTPTRASTA